jgi:DNA polymerase-3 subunit alpha
MGERDAMERAIREAGARRRWTNEQTSELLALLLQHVGYLHPHGHALVMAQHVFRQACLKVNPATAAGFFADVLNNGGSLQYGLGSAVEEARRFAVLVLPPCVNVSGDRFLIDDASTELVGAQDKARGVVGAIRVPLTAIRGLGPEAAHHILAARAAFGGYSSLLDFCRKVDRRRVSRHDLLLLIKLGAFGFTGLSPAQLVAAEQYYASAADVLRLADSDPAGLATLEDDLGSGAIKYITPAEWSPEVVAAYELAHLGFYTASPVGNTHARQASCRRVRRHQHRRAGRLPRQSASQRGRDRHEPASPKYEEGREDGLAHSGRRDGRYRSRGLSECI